MADLQRKTANLFNPEGNWNDFDCSHSISGNDVTVSGLRFSYIAFTAEANTEYAMSHKTVANQRIAIYAGSLSGSALAISTSGFLAFTTSSETQLYILFYASDGTTSNTVTYSEIMLVKGNYTAQTMPPFEPYGWVHSLRKLTTATADIEPTIYSDGTAITAYTLKGNTVQNGTPTPSNPITISGVGNKTANLSPVSSFTITAHDTSQKVDIFSGTLEAGDYVVALNQDNAITGSTRNTLQVTFGGRTYYNSANPNYHNQSGQQEMTFTVTETGNVDVKYWANDLNENCSYSNITFNAGTEIINEPYGYKIPISSGGVTTNLYTAEPLMKIGDVADTINSDGTVTRNIGMVDLGTLTYTTTSSGNFVSTTNISNLRLINNGQMDNAICTEFIEVTPNNVASTPYAFSSCVNTNRTPFLNKTGFENYTVEQFKEAMQGVYMYYILATPTTEQITLPTIPTTEGANTITVDTTVQPSEFTATWTGWHNAYVKEKSENLFDGILQNGYYEDADGTITGTTSQVYRSFMLSLAAGTYTISFENPINLVRLIKDGTMTVTQDTNITSYTVTSTTDGNIGFSFRLAQSSSTPWDNSDIMLNTGSTALPYVPYWE